MKKNILFVCWIIIILFIGIGIGYIAGKKTYVNNLNETKLENVLIKEYKGETYYILDGKYDGEYSLDTIDLAKYYIVNDSINSDKRNQLLEEFNQNKIFSFEEYQSFMNKWELEQEYKDSNKKYLVISFARPGAVNVDVKLADVVFSKDVAHVYMYDKLSGVTADCAGYVMVIPVPESTYSFEIKTLITKEEYKNIKRYGTPNDPSLTTEDKPMIYIYPEKEMEVNIKLGNPDLLTTTYPKYNNGWDVLALPDGTLKYNNREYYGLYWEGMNHYVEVKNEGFVVAGQDVESFLEEKLSILGLNEKEANEFIVYWLPKMERNAYNYIYFETGEEIDSYMPLIVTPKSDSMIRIVMDYKVLDKPLKVKEQILESPIRTGYTVVEWGGSEIQ